MVRKKHLCTSNVFLSSQIFFKSLLFIFCPAGIWLCLNRSILSFLGRWWRWWRRGICPCPASCTPVSYFTKCFCFMAAAAPCLFALSSEELHLVPSDASPQTPGCSHPTDVFKSALRFGTFTAVMATYTASSLLHVSVYMKLLYTVPQTLNCLCVTVYDLNSFCLAGFELPPRCSANISWLHHVHWARWESPSCSPLYFGSIPFREGA